MPGTPITAAFTQAPSVHDGSAKFLLQMAFSHEPKRSFSYRSVRDALFDVAGGRIEKARRLVHGRNRTWEITVVPAGTGAVTLTARATADCAAAHAVCDPGGRRFTGGLELTVPGPASPPVVSVTGPEAAATEGAALTFTLARTEPLAAALTVTVAVTETGSVLDGSPPTERDLRGGRRARGS